MTVASRILDALSQPASVGFDTVSLAASIGIAELSTSDPPSLPAALLQDADAAMYHARRTGKGFAVTWSEELLSSQQPA